LGCAYSHKPLIRGNASSFLKKEVNLWILPLLKFKADRTNYFESYSGGPPSVMCASVCVYERERERGREKETMRGKEIA